VIKKRQGAYGEEFSGKEQLRKIVIVQLFCAVFQGLVNLLKIYYSRYQRNCWM